MMAFAQRRHQVLGERREPWYLGSDVIFRAVHLDERRRDILRNIDHDVPEYETAPLGRMVREVSRRLHGSCRDRHG
jgi:hypothetical protein